MRQVGAAARGGKPAASANMVYGDNGSGAGHNAEDNALQDIARERPLTCLRVWTFAFAVAAPLSLAAQERGSESDQIACTPDVFKLCSAFIPDEDGIIKCLQSKHQDLSPACAQVFFPALNRRNHRR